jgi:predicted AlkP superfamily pyrophosphatase or phosphodiesterase
MIPYAQTVTAAGHACVYTGSVPAIHGILGNEWYDPALGRAVYCVEDSTVQILGGVANSEPMSPANLWTTSIADELRLATNFRSKVIGVAIKDRGSVLPAGHTGTAYWYEGANGNWVSSTHYMPDLPAWVKKFNSRRVVDSLYQFDWPLLYPAATYVQSDQDNVPYEGKMPADSLPVFPHKLAPYIGRNEGAIRVTPFGNTLTWAFAKEALIHEQLGKDEFTDLLAISFSSPDYIGHMFGPNSIEIEDNYLRLDKEMEDIINTLDKVVGKDQWTLFLTADHAVAHNPSFLKKHKINVRSVPSDLRALNQKIARKFGVPDAIKAFDNYQMYLNHPAIDSLEKSAEDISEFIIAELLKLPHVLNAFSYRDLEDAALPQQIKESFVKGYNPKRGGDIQVILKSGFFYAAQVNGFTVGTTHGAWYPYDSHIPLLFMGWGIAPGHTNRVTYMTDIAATLAALLHIQMPSGCIGSPITELLPR